MEFLKEKLKEKGKKFQQFYKQRTESRDTKTLSDTDMWTDRKSTHRDDAAAIIATAILKIKNGDETENKMESYTSSQWG